MGETQKNLPMFTVDSFTNQCFSGNPAAVCICNNGFLAESQMKMIAREMNLSETAFVAPTSTSNRFLLKWFTPTVEVSLCGHATLASGHVLFSFQGQEGIPKVSGDTVEFETLSGILVVQKTHSSLRMDFPQGNPVHVNLQESTVNHLVKALSLPSAADIIEFWHCAATKKLIIEVRSVDIIERVQANEQLLLGTSFGELNVKGVAVTSRGQNSALHSKYQKFDFVSRYFSPWNGIVEDPVTGSLHTALGVMWSYKLNGKRNLLAYQASSRGGELIISLAENNRIFIEGNAVIILRGSIRTQ